MQHSNNSWKIKLLYTMQYLVLNTDRDHPANAQVIIEHLKQFGINAERKAVYRSVSALNQTGIEIKKRGGAFYYVPNEGDIFHAFANSKL